MSISNDGDSTEMRTVRQSSESLLYKDMGSVLPQNVVIENSNMLNADKLWKMQFGRKNISQTGSANVRSAKEYAKKFHSDAVPTMYHQKSFVNDILSQTMKMIN